MDDVCKKRGVSTLVIGIISISVIKEASGPMSVKKNGSGSSPPRIGGKEEHVGFGISCLTLVTKVFGYAIA